ncbi:unnamed protein product [Brachionus calyciflorus]|uniref:Uncharacterized protein n=1 Tax=Brachionus calyciflorus TaxID=104777 RepID=A0A813QAB3_9BILA|nr:unnamed protein product [Brachionus calyciflorus]
MSFEPLSYEINYIGGSSKLDDCDPLERYMNDNHINTKSLAKKENKMIKFNDKNSRESRISINKIQSPIKSINKVTKITNKPPKYNTMQIKQNIKQPNENVNIVNIENSHSIEKPFINLKDFKPNVNLSLDKSITLKNDSIEEIFSNCESDEDIKNESKDLKNLRSKINALRKQLFNEIKESKEILSINDDLSENEIELSIDGDDDDDEKNASSSSDSIFSNIESINLSNKKFSFRPKKIDLPESNFTNSKKQKDLLIDSIDLKAKYLIEKSDNSLNDKIVSSDGLTSNSFGSSMSSSCSTIINDTEIHKPEFIQYIENKNKPSNQPITGETLKPEDDILYQWRLRRKLETSKKSDNSSSIFIPIKLPQSISQVNCAEEKISSVQNESMMNTEPDILISKLKSIEEKEVEIITNFETKTSIQTQTLNLVDTEIQTDLDFDVSKSNDLKTMIKRNEKINENLPIKNDKKTFMNQKNLQFEIPTKDCHENKEIKINLLKKESHTEFNKPKFTSSSPVKQNKLSNYTEYSKSNENSSEEFTKISQMIDRTPLSNLSLPFKSKFSNNKGNERHSVTSSIASTMSSICSSITNVTERNSPNHIQTSSMKLISADIHEPKIDSISVKKTDSFCLLNETNMSTLSEEFLNSFNENDKSLFETDDILRILFKKTYFYQLKLKQIDELLTN